MLRLTLRLVIICLSFGCISGCKEADFALSPTRATIGYTTSVHSDLISLPKPKSKVVVAVYKFRDQTGQYKTSAQATTFSTAVTQGATSMLSKALEDSGWFSPIEREGLSNLLNERKIITATRMQAESMGGPKLPSLPPLLYAGVLIEGGIIGYDTNFVTGGLGARYFGVGGSGEMRKDRITIYLRLVSVRNGQVLKSVSTTKTVLSKEVDFGVYRYVSVKRLFEFETGLSTNEPVTVCVLEAIEKAVHDLIIEGIHDGLWALENPEDVNSPLIQSYLKEKAQMEKLVTFDKKGRLMKVGEVQQPQESAEQAEPGLVEPVKIDIPKKSEETEDSKEGQKNLSNQVETVADHLKKVIGEPKKERKEQTPSESQILKAEEKDKFGSAAENNQNIIDKPEQKKTEKPKSKPKPDVKSESESTKKDKFKPGTSKESKSQNPKAEEKSEQEQTYDHPEEVVDKPKSEKAD